MNKNHHSGVLKNCLFSFTLESLSLFSIFSKKPITPTKSEIKQNVNSRSAKMRYAVRNNNSFFNSKEIRKNFENYLKIEEMRI